MRRFVVVVLLVLGVVSIPALARAHPLGNFSINQYVGLQLAHGALGVDYVLDLAEIPAVREREAIGDIGEYAASKCDELAPGLRIAIDGTPVSLEAMSSFASFLPGQAGLETLRLECGYRGSLAGAGGTLTIDNDNYERRAGWNEITVVAAGLDVETEAPAKSASDRLRVYPGDPAKSSPQMRSAEVRIVGVGAVTAEAAPGPVRSVGLFRPVDAFAGLITRAELGLSAGLVALAAAIGLGAVHAAAPGHGKTLMAAYLVGTNGTKRQASILGLSVALSHTAGVLVLGLITLWASTSFSPDRVYPFLTALSGLIIFGIGLGLVWKRVRHRGHHHHPHDHVHPHGSELRTVNWKSLAALGLSGGLVPSASAVLLLLGAIQLGRVEFGLLLILAFGLGMAATLVGAGFAVVAASRFGLGLMTGRVWAGRLHSIMPTAAALAVVVLGAWISIGSLQNILH